ncbi:MAG: hypothetical protein OXF93_20585 [Acidobacteria bacterium]|nr:hypothetical protein [Acidobacteriota bacterium]
MRIPSLCALVFFLGFFGQAAAQVDAAGSWKVALNGGGTLGDHPNFNTNIGFSRFTESGFELGGDIVGIYAGGGFSGFGFFRGTYNFIGESLTVPFVGFGYGSTLGGGLSAGVYQVGGGIKRFLSERASFDFGVNYQGITEGGAGQMSLQFGMSLYLGN